MPGGLECHGSQSCDLTVTLWIFYSEQYRTVWYKIPPALMTGYISYLSWNDSNTTSGKLDHHQYNHIILSWFAPLPHVKPWIVPCGRLGLIRKTGVVPLQLITVYAAWKNAWWRHQMETFAALLAICAGNSSVPGEFPAQRPVTRSFDVFFDLHSNKRLRKQWWGWWFETLSFPLWRHRNGPYSLGVAIQ